MSLPRSFFQKIGSKGGRNGKFSLAKRLSAQKAAKARWDKRRAVEQLLPKASH